MPFLRVLTAGESHGKALIGIIEGLPSGIPLFKEKIDFQLKRRQTGFGRGGRMEIESDSVEFLSGLRFGKTLGSPIALMIENKDWPNWKDGMDPFSGRDPVPVHIPRPGHADFAGSIKFDHADLRNVLERASARETAMRVAAGSVIMQFLELFHIWIGSHVVQIGNAKNDQTFLRFCEPLTPRSHQQIRDAFLRAESSSVRCSHPSVDRQMIESIQNASQNGDTIGGQFELAALNVPIGLGSYSFWDKRLDANIASAVMGIPGIKSVEIGLGSESAVKKGSEVHDAFHMDDIGTIQRSSNRAGGIEGGISNGQPILVRAAMKPIPTLKKPLGSVHLQEKKNVLAHQERSDVCAVPAASIVAEAMLAVEIGKAFCERFGGDSMDQVKAHYETH